MKSYMVDGRVESSAMDWWKMMGVVRCHFVGGIKERKGHWLQWEQEVVTRPGGVGRGSVLIKGSWRRTRLGEEEGKGMEMAIISRLAWCGRAECAVQHTCVGLGQGRGPKSHIGPLTANAVARSHASRGCCKVPGRFGRGTLYNQLCVKEKKTENRKRKKKKKKHKNLLTSFCQFIRNIFFFFPSVKSDNNLKKRQCNPFLRFAMGHSSLIW